MIAKRQFVCESSWPETNRVVALADDEIIPQAQPGHARSNVSTAARAGN
ncbi:hypothetical protein [Brevibacterium sp. UCMA 11754]|nr:hypothetical protein [Brevibacterium sp. UCMA 11754]MCF2574580.1 hypothetical protein [Brevibacterium sp. UCMA 11754]